MKIYLIAPKNPESFWTFDRVLPSLGKRCVFPNLALPTVAGLTPPFHEVVLCDENVEPVDFDTDADVVGITGFVVHKQRMLELAEAFRCRGKLVVAGGGAGSLSDAHLDRHSKGGLAMRPLRGLGILVLTVVLASAWGCGSTATKEGTGEYVDDSVITAKVKTAIFNDATLKVNEINVETFKGVVQLSGFVRSQADIDKAVQVARGIAGVKSVKNDMRIK